MTDPRVSKLAKVLVHYSLELKPGDKFELWSQPNAELLLLAVYAEAIKAGAHVVFTCFMEEMRELFLKYASDEQIDFVSPVERLVMESFDATLSIKASTNRRYLVGVDPQRIAQAQKAQAELNRIMFERLSKKQLRLCITIFPNNAHAQDADMSLRDYEDFVYGAGKVNFPDGEIFTGPVEDSIEDWIRYKYPTIYFGQEVADIELWFEKGKIVKEKAGRNQELLISLLNTDAGSRYVGEWGIGTNYGIKKFTKNMVFDEKIGGTIHLAVGSSFPETGGRNESGIHCDMLCDMSESEIKVDGDLFYKDGHFVI